MRRSITFSFRLAIGFDGEEWGQFQVQVAHDLLDVVDELWDAHGSWTATSEAPDSNAFGLVPFLGSVDHAAAEEVLNDGDDHAGLKTPVRV